MKQSSVPNLSQSINQQHAHSHSRAEPPQQAYWKASAQASLQALKEANIRNRIWKTWVILLLAGLLAAFAAKGVRAAEGTDKADTQAIINAQLKAFQEDDSAKAFNFASPHVQRVFKSPANFMHMVRTEYDMVYRPANVLFVSFETNGQMAAHKMQFTDRNKSLWNVVYTLEKQRNGQWAITGCEAEKAAIENI